MNISAQTRSLVRSSLKWIELGFLALASTPIVRAKRDRESAVPLRPSLASSQRVMCAHAVPPCGRAAHGAENDSDARLSLASSHPGATRRDHARGKSGLEIRHDRSRIDAVDCRHPRLCVPDKLFKGNVCPTAGEHRDPARCSAPRRPTRLAGRKAVRQNKLRNSRCKLKQIYL